MELILTRIERDFGERGVRAAEMLRTAKSLIDSGPLTPRIGETVAYCLREALVEIPRTANLQGEEWKQVSRKVVEERRRYEQMQGLSGMDADLAIKGLLQSIDDLGELHNREGIHLQGVRQILRVRTGVDPLDHDANILNDYQKLIDDVQKMLHNSGTMPIVPLELASEYFRRVLELFSRLFLVDERLERLQELAVVPNPTAEDGLKLQGLLISPHDLRFFVANVVSHAWLDLMLDQGLLDPLPDPGAAWPASIILSRLRNEHSEELAKWLERAWNRWSGTPEGIVALTMAAHEAGESGQPVMLRCLQRHPDVPVVCQMAMWTYGQIDSEHPDVEAFADCLLNPGAEIDRYSKENDIPKKLVSGMTAANVVRRIQILVYKIRLNSAEDKLFYVEDRGSIANQREEWQRDVTWSLVDALIKSLQRAIDLGISGEELLPSLTDLPQVLQAHIQAWLRANVDDLKCQEVVEFVAEAIGTRLPTGDDLLLINRIMGQCPDSGFVGIWQEAIGTPPYPVDVGKAVKEDPVPEGLIRRWLWSVILPPEIEDSWQDCQAVLGSALGNLGRDDFLRPSFRSASFSGPNSPFTFEDFKSLSPEAVATLMSDWRPTANDSWELRSARGVGRQLESMVKNAPHSWAQDPVRIVAKLKHPTYIGHYFLGLAEVADQLEGLGDPIVQAMGLARTHPWSVVPLGGDDYHYDHDWKAADKAGIRLIKALAEKRIELDEAASELAWSFTIEAARDRSQPSGMGGEDADMHMSAINRPCTEALGTVISLIQYEHQRSFRIPDEALDLLTESLKLDGRDGAEHRAILSPRIPFLRQVIPEWFERNLGLFLGDSAPDGLAQVSVDLWLRWNRTERWLLEHSQDRVIQAVQRKVEGALQGFLLGMFWQVPGYDVPTCVRRLSDLGPQYVSEAGETTARILRHDDTPSEAVELGASFWAEILRNIAEPEALRGFGWWAEVSKLADDQWQQLTLGTCEKSHGNIDWAPHVAERAATGPISSEAIRILTYLVRAPFEYWESSRVADHALDALRESVALEQLKDARDDLRRALLERGFHMAREVE